MVSRIFSENTTPFGIFYPHTRENHRFSIRAYIRGNVTTMDSGPEPRASCITRKTILMISSPISIR